MDISDTLAPKSDQLDYDDFLAGDRTFTIKEVRRGPSAEQPVEIVMAGFDRPWRPAKSMRRVLAAAWGTDGSTYAGKRLTLFGDPTVKWGGQAVGGIRLRAMSDIDGPLTVNLTTTRGQRKPFVVQPLPSEPEWRSRVSAAPDVAALKTIHTEATNDGWVTPELMAALAARKAELIRDTAPS